MDLDPQAPLAPALGVNPPPVADAVKAKRVEEVIQPRSAVEAATHYLQASVANIEECQFLRLKARGFDASSR